jgi:hypothetical protein
MAYVSKARRVVREMREPVPGNGKMLVPGKIHHTSIASAILDGAQLHIRFEDAFGETHLERIFILGRSKKDLSFIMKALVVAVSDDVLLVRDLHDRIMDEDFDWLPGLVGKPVSIETEYRGSFVNLKSIRGPDAIDNGGSFFQSAPPNTTHTETSPNPPVSTRYAATPDAATAFFGPRS